MPNKHLPQGSSKTLLHCDEVYVWSTGGRRGGPGRGDGLRRQVHGRGARPEESVPRARAGRRPSKLALTPSETGFSSNYLTCI